MQLIKILKSEINTEIVNSVNARELHKKLGISKHFTQWIQVQLSRANLDIEKDYILLNQKVSQVSGAKYLKEYILTLDSAKHIAMMSQSSKGKDIRNYFISVEKESNSLSKQNNQDLTNLTSAVLEQTKMLSQVFLRFNNVEEELRETKAIMHTIKRQVSKIDDVNETTSSLDKFLKEQPIEEDQIFKIRNAVMDRSQELAKKHNIHAEIVINFIYSKIREKYSLKTYLSLKKTMFTNCLYMIDRIELTEYLNLPKFEGIDTNPKEDIAQEKM